MWNNNFGAWGGVGFWFHVHIFFMLAVLAGLIFLIILAAKYLKKEQITKWAAWLLGVGIIGALATSFVFSMMWGFAGKFFDGNEAKLKSGYNFGPGMMRWYLEDSSDK